MPVLSCPLPAPLTGEQLGVVASSPGAVSFRDVRALSRRPRAFVVMQFGEPYDSLYQEVIAPTCIAAGFDVERADDVYGPGLILSDIVQRLAFASVVIAEVTPANAKVFYELGYAHALEKPAIMLAERGRTLPFDVNGHRCIFYDNSIAGKPMVEKALERHLQALPLAR